MAGGGDFRAPINVGPTGQPKGLGSYFKSDEETLRILSRGTGSLWLLVENRL